MSEAKEVTEFVFDKMEQYFNAAQQVIQKYGGDVADLALNALRVDAAAIVVTGVAMLVIGVISIRAGISWVSLATQAKFFSEGEREKDARKALLHTIYDKDIEPLYGIAGTLSIMGGGVLLTMGIIRAGEVWAWVGLFYPELYAVHKFLLN